MNVLQILVIYKRVLLHEYSNCEDHVGTWGLFGNGRKVMCRLPLNVS
jgi:hypothetical protein